MSRVPSQEPRPESDQAAEAAAAPSPLGAPTDLPPIDLPARPSPSLDEPARPQGAPGPSGSQPPETPAEQPGRDRSWDALLGAGPPTAGYRPDGGLSPEPATLSTTGVPHYLPPAAVPEFPRSSEGAVPFGAVAAPPMRPRSVARSLGRGLREVAETVILALVIFLLVRAVVQNFQVEGRSMEPSLESGWYLLVNKALYWEINLETFHKFIPFIDPADDPTRYIFRGPRRGDIIVFRAPDQTRGEPERDFIKRIIGLPGETVEVRDCTVFVNGEPLDEPYIEERPNYDWGPETVPPGHYFVLGDNRNNSSDSHSWGMLPRENIIGQAWITYWPFSDVGLVDNTSVEPGGGEVQAAEGSAAGKPQLACP